MSDRTMASADDFAMNEDDMECIARLLPMDDVSSAYPLVDLVDDDSTSTSTSQSCTLREIRVAALVYLFQCFRPGDVIASLGVFAPCHSVTHSVYLRRIKTFPDLWDAKSKVFSSLSHALVNVEFDMGTNSVRAQYKFYPSLNST
ncbi:hypothetical protein H310_03660 [Aphanomyces invadans]|uniref:Uncharacterized protein n=1 Tax=Aphanomyces invadans TaxID=157072 RepID=A0A024UIQ0_9STRA|nr:hypothetical protein H310_03660 [Aphanomyces invadans]ETW06065.1 hypothetical protein H310_03660 [Aphanomyces invadans]|eukprot:XP_008865842.1 hypothetical protein H310_03660 [Aphanomyces invadans]